MNAKLILLHVLFLLFVKANAQADNVYAENIKKAEAYTAKKDYSNAVKSYSLAFGSNNGKAFLADRYNAGRAWALYGNKDSAFNHLFRAAKNGKYADYNSISKDTALRSLYTDKKWNELLAIVKSNKDKAEANLIKPLVAQLDSIFNEDQSIRNEITALGPKIGWDAKELKPLYEKLRVIDSVNLVKVTAILDEYGWLGPDKVGANGALTLFLVIQHLPKTKVHIMEKYLPKLREAVEKKQASATHLVYLEDRIAWYRGRKQLYGTQLELDSTGKNVLAPLEDPDNVDKRRATLGLDPLGEYLKHFNIKWDLEAYKKEQAEREKNIKK